MLSKFPLSQCRFKNEPNLIVPNSDRTSGRGPYYIDIYELRYKFSPNSLFFPCKEGVLISTSICPIGLCDMNLIQSNTFNNNFSSAGTRDSSLFYCILFLFKRCNKLLEVFQCQTNLFRISCTGVWTINQVTLEDLD